MAEGFLQAATFRCNAIVLIANLEVRSTMAIAPKHRAKMAY
jgi:hypothetical protein